MTALGGNTVLQQIPLEGIRVSSTNPRQSFDAAGIEELTASIAAMGVQVPLLVRPTVDPDDGEKGFYELVAGERRLRAAIALKLETIPCLVRELTDEQARETQIVENLQRADVHPVEEAEAYRQLIDAAARIGDLLTAEDVAKRVGKSTAYVAQRLRLLDMELDAKLLFVKGHITLRHALLLARLTPLDQERALRFMLDCDPKYDKRSIAELVRDRLGIKTVDGEDEDEDGDEDEGVSYNMPNPKVVKYMRHGRRIVDATEAQLKRWIESNVLLQLSSVPWRLDDAELLPAAGACITCPKRSGSNAALFGDLTAEADVCLDTACFAAKQDATVKAHKEAARQSAKAEGAQGWLLKISCKVSRAPLDEVAVSNGQVVTRKTVKAGQWVEAAGDGKMCCGNTVQALAIDGPDKGKLLWCCADQKCKVHKHNVNDPHSSQSRAQPAETEEQRAKRELDLKRERILREEIYAAITKKVSAGLDGSGALAILRTMIGKAKGWDDEVDASVCRQLGIALDGGDAERPLSLAIAKADLKGLLLIGFHVMHCCSEVQAYVLRDLKGYRKPLMDLAKSYGAAAAAEAIVAKFAKAQKVKVSAAKKAVGKKAAAPVAKGKKSKPVTLTPAGRKRIADAVKRMTEARRKKAAK